MTQQTKTVIAMASESEKAALEKEVGFIVCNLGQTGGDSFEKAVTHARDLAKSTGSRWGVFKLAAVAEPEPVSKVRQALIDACKGR